MHKGNREKVRRNKKSIVRRLQDGERLMNLCREYHVGHSTMKEAILRVLTETQFREITKSHSAQGGVANRFKPGHKPYNKRLKGVRMSPGTEFKKGHRPQTWRPVGTVIIRKRPDRGGYRQRRIKVAEPNRWKPFIRWLWETKVGPIPEGCFLIHKNSDSLDDRIDNIMPVDRVGNLNYQRNKTPEIETRRKKRAAEALRKYWRRRRQEKALALQMRLVEQRKAAASPPLRIIWMCSSCGYTYDGDCPPVQCNKCNRGGFERNILPQRMRLSQEQFAEAK